MLLARKAENATEQSQGWRRNPQREKAPALNQAQQIWSSFQM